MYLWNLLYLIGNIESQRPIGNVLVVGKKFIGMLSGVHWHASIRFDLFCGASTFSNNHGIA
jgi:hypothetical protein